MFSSLWKQSGKTIYFDSLGASHGEKPLMAYDGYLALSTSNMSEISFQIYFLNDYIFQGT